MFVGGAFVMFILDPEPEKGVPLKALPEPDPEPEPGENIEEPLPLEPDFPDLPLLPEVEIREFADELDFALLPDVGIRELPE